MLVCKQCGKDNDLGRVFCASCGAKLDLEGMSSEVVAEAIHKSSWIGKHWGKILLVVVLLLLVPVTLAVWPGTKPIGKPASKNGRIVEGRIAAFSRLRKGQKMTQSFKEEDINAFLAMKADQLKVKSLSIALQNGRFDVRLVKSLMPQGITVSTYKWDPKVSYDLVCTPWGGRPVVGRASIGHLPLGPFKSTATGKISALISGDKDWKALESVTEIKVTAEGVELFAQK